MVLKRCLNALFSVLYGEMLFGTIGYKELNTTAYHPQCDGAVERFNRTLKTILRKHAAKFGCQWDRVLPGVLWVYRNTPHTSTGEKPSFLLYGIDCRSPTEAAYLPTEDIHPTDVDDYRGIDAVAHVSSSVSCWVHSEGPAALQRPV